VGFSPKCVSAGQQAVVDLRQTAITSRSGFVHTPTGQASVCYRPAAGAAFADAQQEVVALLRADADAPAVEAVHDDFGFTWLVVTGDRSDVAGLCTDLHAVNTTLEQHGFEAGLLCSLVPFADAAGRRFGLTYLYKQGTFYPFAPSGDQERDTLLELSVRDVLEEELPMEPDLQRWLAVWTAPGL